MKDQPSEQILRRAAEQPYEDRSPQDNEVLAKLLTEVLSPLEAEYCKILCLFLQLVPGESTQFKNNCQVTSIVIQKGREDKFQLIDTSSRERIEELDLTKFALYIPAEGASRAKTIQSIEQEIKFLRNCSYLQQIPKRKLYHVLRNADIHIYSFDQSVYKQKQQVNPGQSSVYIVRRGEFAYQKNIHSQRSTILYEFGSREAFGTEDLAQSQESRTRQFGVVCRCAQGIVYKFSQEFYNSFLKASCEIALSINQQKLSKFLEERIKKVQKCRQANSELITQSKGIHRSFSLSAPFLTVLNRPQFCVSKEVEHSMVSVKKEERVEKLPSLYSNPAKYKQSATKSPKSNHGQNPEYQQLLLIQQKKEKYQRVRSILGNKAVSCRGEILLGLVKSSWDNYKNRAKASHK